MNHKIAVLYDENLKLSSFENCQRIGVYERENESWEKIRDHTIHIGSIPNITSIRSSIQSIVEQLTDCNAIAGLSVTGLIYYAFEKMNFNIYEIKEISDSIFNEIILEMEEIEKQYKKVIHHGPRETNLPGHYFLDLIELQKRNPEISSKQAIQPLLKKGSFHELVLICNHIPPWLQGNSELCIQASSTDGVIKATIELSTGQNVAVQ